MPGRVVTNDNGDKAWWDGERLTPLPAGSKQLEAAQYADNRAAGVEHMARPYSPETQDALKQGREMAVKDANKTSGMLTRNVLVPLAETGIAVGTGGASIPVQSLISAGTEAGFQQAGLKPKSLPQVAMAGLGPVASSLAQKGVKAIGRHVFGGLGNEAIKEAGQGTAATRLGQPADVIERATKTPASKPLYEAAENAGQVDTAHLRDVIGQALNKEKAMSTPDADAVKRLTALKDKLNKNPSLDSQDVMAELDRIGKAKKGALRRGDTTTAAGLKEAEQAGNEAVAKDIPTLGSADVQYTREQATKDIYKALGRSEPTTAINSLIQDNKRLTSVMSPEELNDMRDIAHKMSGVLSSKSSGVFGKGVDLLRQGVAEMLGDKTGRAILRQTMGPNGAATPTTIHAATTFWRAYQAYQGEQK